MRKRTNHKPYPGEFREQVVKLAQTSGRSVKDAAEEFEISTASVRRWVRQAERDQGMRKDGLSTSERQELARPAAREPEVAHGAGNPVKSSGLVRSGGRSEPVRVFAFVKAHQKALQLS